jgi:hypothetical protein
VRANGQGSYTAFFGYLNHNSYEVTIPIGPDNGFSPAPPDRGQPELFAPGRQRSVFRFNFDGTATTWTLDGSTAAAGAGGPPCD